VLVISYRKIIPKAAAMGDFYLLTENLEALDKIFTLNSASTQVILIGIPVLDTAKGENCSSMIVDHAF
jgi:hypothetical protein